MRRSSFSQLRWLAGIVLPAMVLLLIARLGDLPTDAGAPSLAGRGAALVTCVLSANPIGSTPAAPPAATTETDRLECEGMWIDSHRTAWMSAC
jgi:hypothetical protein